MKKLLYIIGILVLIQTVIAIPTATNQYKFDTSSVVQIDTTTNSNLTRTGTPIFNDTSCIINGCFFYPGSGDYWTMNTSEAFGGNMTLLAWIKVPVTPTNTFPTLFYAQTNKELAVYTSDGGGTPADVFNLDTGDGVVWDGQCLTTIDTTIDTWTHIAIRLDATQNTIHVFRNGTLNTICNSRTHFNGLTLGNHWIGARAGSGTEEMDGFIDEFALYNTGVNDSDIKQIFEYELDGIQYPYNAITNISQASLNHTSAINTGNESVWQINKSAISYTLDSTPTVKFTTNFTSNCTIGTINTNYTSMLLDDPNRQCSTLNTKNQTCTLPTTDKITSLNQYIYISCIGLNQEETLNSTSGALRISLLNNPPELNFSANYQKQNVPVGATWRLNTTIYDADNDTLNLTRILITDGSANITIKNISVIGEPATQIMYDYLITDAVEGANLSFNVSLTDGSVTVINDTWIYIPIVNRCTQYDICIDGIQKCISTNNASVNTSIYNQKCSSINTENFSLLYLLLAIAIILLYLAYKTRTAHYGIMAGFIMSIGGMGLFHKWFYFATLVSLIGIMFMFTFIILMYSKR